MRIRGHGTAVAVVLSVLALAVAGGGTAVAVDRGEGSARATWCGSANSASTEQQLSVTQWPVNASGACQSDYGSRELAVYHVTAGDDVVDEFSAPLLVKPVGTTAYCIYVKVDYLGSFDAIPSYHLVYGLSAYTVAGRYTGIGTTTPAAEQPTSAAVPR